MLGVALATAAAVAGGVYYFKGTAARPAAPGHAHPVAHSAAGTAPAAGGAAPGSQARGGYWKMA